LGIVHLRSYRTHQRPPSFPAALVSKEHFMRFRHLLPLAALAAWLGIAASAEAQISTTATFNFSVGTIAPSTSYWSGGHGDIDIHFDDDEWEIHYHFHDDDEDKVATGGNGFPGNPFQDEWEAGDLTTFINTAVTSGDPATPVVPRIRAAGSQWDFTGVAEGAIFYVLPASETTGLPYLGFSAEDHTFDITYSLGAVTGGVISAWTQDGLGQPTPYWSSVDPLSNGGFTVPAGGHEHMFIGFSALGDYTAAITAVPEPASLGLAGVAGLGLAAFAWIRRRRA
jgi:hypothetical protein